MVRLSSIVCGPLSIWPTILAAPALLVGQGSREHVDRSQGFRLERPESWKFLPATTVKSTHVLRARPGSGVASVEVSVRVKEAVKGETAASVLDQARAFAANDAGYANWQPITGELAGRKTVGMRVDYTVAGQPTYRIEQNYLVVEGRRFILQCHAPKARWREFAEDFAAARASFQIVKPSREARAARMRTGLAARCGSEIEWASSWAEAARRAKAEKKLVMVQLRSYPGFALADRTRVNLYMDRDIIELIDSRLVPVRLTPKMPSPLRSQKRYGMSGSTFGQAVMLVTPGGEVLGETSSIHPQAVYDFLVAGVQRNPKFAGAPRPEGADPASWHLARGELVAASRELDGRTGAAAHRARASLWRRQRRGEEALAELALARQAGDDSVELHLEEVEIDVRMANEPRARRRLRNLLKAKPESRDLPAVMYWQGLCDARARETDSATRWWQRLMRDHGESRWAWLAAAQALGQALQPRWPAAVVLETMRDEAPAPLAIAEVAAADAAGTTFLLARQQENGSWISPSEVLRAGAKTPHPFTEAVTAICGRALLQRQSSPDCRRAAERGLEFLLEARALVKKYPPPRSYMDYSVWSESLVLWFLADCLEARLGAAPKIRAAARELVRNLGGRQQSTGGWSYYVTGDLESSQSTAQSISFVTAPVLLSLLRARELGIEVPPAMTEEAMRCLARTRTSAGTFSYFLFAEGRTKPTGAAGAAGRGPVCELALLRGGKSDVARVEKVMQIFTRYRLGLAKEVGKVLMHAGPDGQGCHYPLFDYAFAAAAIAELPAGRREPHRSKLLELLMATRSKEGAFRDTQFNGWEYGTAMALLAFRALSPDR